MQNIYINIKKRRLELGITQYELAKRLGYKDKSSIAKIEKGLVDIPPSKLSAIADELNTTVNELINSSKTKDNKEIISENIKYYMNLKDVRATDVAKVLGIAMATFSDWVNAKSYPRIDKIELLADYFGVSKSELIEEKTDNDNILKKIKKYNILLHEAENLKIQIMQEIEQNGSDVTTWTRTVTDISKFLMYIDEDKASELL